MGLSRTSDSGRHETQSSAREYLHHWGMARTRGMPPQALRPESVRFVGSDGFLIADTTLMLI